MSEGFEPEVTQEQFTFAGDVSTFVTIPGTIVCGLVLIAYGSIAVGAKSARQYLNRVSFRLLTYSLFFNVIYGIGYALTPGNPGRGCIIGAFFNNVALCLSTFLTTCIAINLQLVLVHGWNGDYLEKFYLFGSTFLTVLLNVPTVALNQFGWDEDTATCWYSNDDPRIRLSWIIGTSSLWVALATTIETICSAALLVWLYIQIKDIKNLQRSTRTPTNVIIRIALYPIISLTMNYSTVVLDLYVTLANVETQKNFRLLVLDLVFYGLRGFAYGLLAAADPSFIKAVKAVFMEQRISNETIDERSKNTPMRFANNTANTNSSLSGAVFYQSTDPEGQMRTLGEEEKTNVERQL